MTSPYLIYTLQTVQLQCKTNGDRPQCIVVVLVHPYLWSLKMPPFCIVDCTTNKGMNRLPKMVSNRNKGVGDKQIPWIFIFYYWAKMNW